MIHPRRTTLLSAFAVLALAAGSPAFGAADAPLASPEEGIGRPILKMPVAQPSGSAPTVDTSRPADAKIRDGGVRLELWVPHEPVVSGSWLSAALRITNLGSQPIQHAGATGDFRCENPTETALALQGLFDAGEAWDGNSATVKRAFLDLAPLSRQRLQTVASTAAEDCGARIGPGRSVEVQLASVPSYAFRDQPLPTGTAEVESWFSFTRKGASDRMPTVLEVSAPVQIVGDGGHYPAPQELIDAVLRDPQFRGWLDDRDLTQDWAINLDGIYAPRGHTFAGLGYEGGPAPYETVSLSVYARGASEGRASVTIDPWASDVESVTIG